MIDKLLPVIANQISNESTGLTITIPYNDIGFFGSIIGIGYIGFESYRRTRTRTIQIPPREFYR